MKITIISKMFFAFALMLSLTSFASEKKDGKENTASKKSVNFDASLFQLANTSKLKLSVDKGAGSNLRILLKDKGGRVLYSEMYGKDQEQYRRVFNLNDMNDGTYFFELFYKGEKVVKEISIQTNSERKIALQ